MKIFLTVLIVVFTLIVGLIPVISPITDSNFPRSSRKYITSPGKWLLLLCLLIVVATLYLTCTNDKQEAQGKRDLNDSLRKVRDSVSGVVSFWGGKNEALHQTNIELTKELGKRQDLSIQNDNQNRDTIVYKLISGDNRIFTNQENGFQTQNRKVDTLNFSLKNLKIKSIPQFDVPQADAKFDQAKNHTSFTFELRLKDAQAILLDLRLFKVRNWSQGTMQQDDRPLRMFSGEEETALGGINYTTYDDNGVFPIDSLNSIDFIVYVIYKKDEYSPQKTVEIVRRYHHETKETEILTGEDAASIRRIFKYNINQPPKISRAWPRYDWEIKKKK